mmetsp:Transcript_114521/g.220583  ORF Transcript_114521/g.220583 Transcript_114521/m.220583 type:complete len:116 (+) Transcript_114521:104-451(+)
MVLRVSTWILQKETKDFVPCFASQQQVIRRPSASFVEEVPLQQHEVRSRYFNGEFHLSFFSGHSFQRMMERNGFESVYLDSSEGDKGLRTLFRKPAAGDPQAIGVFCGGGSAAAA